MSKVMNNNVNYSSNFNKAVFNGNLASDPRLTSFQTRGGKTVHIVYFRVLADNYYNGYKTTSALECTAFQKHAINIAKNFKKGDFVEANSTISTYPTKNIQGVKLQYPVTITRFNVYKLDNLMNKKSTDKKQSSKEIVKDPFAKNQKKPASDTKSKKAPKADNKKNAPKAKKPAKKQNKKVATK